MEDVVLIFNNNNNTLDCSLTSPLIIKERKSRNTYNQQVLRLIIIVTIKCAGSLFRLIARQKRQSSGAHAPVASPGRSTSKLWPTSFFHIAPTIKRPQSNDQNNHARDRPRSAPAPPGVWCGAWSLQSAQSRRETCWFDGRGPIELSWFQRWLSDRF